MIQKEFRDKLAKHSSTSQQVLERHKIADDIHCTGICAGMSSNKLEHESLVRLTFDPVSEDGSKPPPPVDIDLPMGELPGAADYMLMGFPDIVRLNVRFYEDADLNVWVEFGALGITVLAETPPRSES